MEHLEGRQSVLSALRARHRRFREILLRHGIHEQQVREVLDLAAQAGVAVRYAPAAELDALAHGATHGGILAVCGPKPRATGEELIVLLDSLRAPPLLLLLEGVDDARNLGFVLRSAEALGAHAVLIKKHLWDFDPIEIARPSGGAFERLPLVQFEDVATLESLKRRGIKLIGCIAGVKRSIWDTDLSGPVLLAIGGEKRGLSGAVRSICDSFATIPTTQDASLALTHAASIVLAEASRQRRG
ncbi:MAG: TrmH family RNA methyltransferase [Tepidisphaeraceae bacterium]